MLLVVDNSICIYCMLMEINSNERAVASVESLIFLTTILCIQVQTCDWVGPEYVEW